MTTRNLIIVCLTAVAIVLLVRGHSISVEVKHTIILPVKQAK